MANYQPLRKEIECLVASVCLGLPGLSGGYLACYGDPGHSVQVLPEFVIKKVFQK